MKTVSIEHTPDVCGGEARLAGRRIAVWMLVEAKRLGLTDEEIASRYDPPLAKEELAAAWAYERDRGLEVDRALWLNEACMVEQENGIPVELLARGRKLGFTDEEIREGFEPPLTPEQFASAWQRSIEAEHSLGSNGSRG